MDIDGFVQWWQGRTRDDIERMVEAVEHTRDTADATVGWMRSAQDVVFALRRSGRAREGCEAAHRTMVAVLDACTATGLSDENRSGAIHLARAAGDAALGIVAGEHTSATETLLRPFFGATVLAPA